MFSEICIILTQFLSSYAVSYLEQLLMKVKDESEKVDLHLNIKKTKIMTTAQNKNFSIKMNGEETEVVDSLYSLAPK